MRVDGPLDELAGGLFNDASMFPPEAMSLSNASAAFLRHRGSSYRELVGSLVCQRARLAALADLARSRGAQVPVSLVVPRGLAEVAPAMAAARRSEHLDIRALELPLGQQTMREALAALTPLLTGDRAIYLELAPATFTEVVAHQLAASGLGLKLRLGATSLSSFQPESEVARLLVLCAAERLPLICAAGLHRAVRHRDADSYLQHHGYLNIALAVRVAGSTANADATRAVLADTNPLSVVERARALTVRDVRAIRAVLHSVDTFDLTESVRDLVQLGLGSDS